jgi:hypothetical protein
MLSLSGLFLCVLGEEVEAVLGAEDSDNVESVFRRDFCTRRTVRGLMTLPFDDLRVAAKSETITKRIIHIMILGKFLFPSLF